MLLVERYNDIDNVVELLCGGDIMSLRDDLQHTIFENPKNYEHPSDCDVKIANGMCDYLLNGNGKYKYLYDGDKWYVVDGLCESDCVTPLRRPLPLAKAIKIWLM